MMDILELRNAVQKAFTLEQLIPERLATWKHATEMGWLLIDVPEEFDGLELGSEAVATICFEQARVLSPAPLIPAFLGLEAFVCSPEFLDHAGWIKKVIEGAYIPANLLTGTLTIDGNYHLQGQMPGVLEADMAEFVLVSAPDNCVIVPITAAGVKVTERQTWDRSRRMFDLALDRVQVDAAFIVARDARAAALHERLTQISHLLIAADALGGATAALDRTIEYLKVRRQFDRPLAMFQALKHRCADMKTLLLSAEALLWSRAKSYQSAPSGLGGLKAHACAVFEHVAEEMIQLHGGIGLTDEHSCHLFLKRAMLNLQLYGDADQLWRSAGAAALAAH